MRAAITFALLAFLASLGGSIDAVAESETVQVIVNVKNPVTKVSKQFVADAFLKKRTRWGRTSAIQPVDLGQKSSVRAKFSRSLLDRDVTAVRRYWAQLVFSGRGVPPPEVTDEEAVKAYVAKNPGAIGYVSTSATLTGVKAVAID